MSHSESDGMARQHTHTQACVCVVCKGLGRTKEKKPWKMRECGYSQLFTEVCELLIVLLWPAATPPPSQLLIFCTKGQQQSVAVCSSCCRPLTFCRESERDLCLRIYQKKPVVLRQTIDAFGFLSAEASQIVAVCCCT